MSGGKEEIKINKNIAVNELKNITKFNKDNNNFNERTNRNYNNTLIASDCIEAQKQVNGSFQSKVDRNNNGVWDWFNPQKIAENHAKMVNNFTSYLLNTANLVNNTLASNMRVYNTALEQTRDNLKGLCKNKHQLHEIRRTIR